MQSQANTRVPVVAGLFYAAMYCYASYQPGILQDFLPSRAFLEGAFLLFLAPCGLLLVQRLVAQFVTAPLARAGLGASFYRYEAWTYALPGVALLFPSGLLAPSLAVSFVVLAALLLLQLALYVFLLDQRGRGQLMENDKTVALLFMASGFSALIYQVVWQRTLFTTFGVNSESVTVIVSVFMFGLGIGALAGGLLQKLFPTRLLQVFLFLEMSIGVFGLFSLEIIGQVSHAAGAASSAQLVFWVYLILAIPTFLMGATLPVLVAFMQGYFRNIGKTVGQLYAFNTIGSAIAALFTVQVLFVLGGQKSTVLVAALCNFVVAFLIWRVGRHLQRSLAPAGAVQGRPIASDGARQPGLPYWFVLLTLAAIGYISLSQEILWYRLLGYMTANRPQVFGMMLCAFLVGIAVGSLKSKAMCSASRDPWRFLLFSVAAAILVFYLAVPLVSFTSGLIGKSTALVLGYVLVGVVAALTGGILPMLIHLGTADRESAATMPVAWLYFANIIGATAGPLLTGFYLLEEFSLEANVVLLSGVTALFLLALFWMLPAQREQKLKLGSGVLLACALCWTVHDGLYALYLERLQFAELHPAPFRHKLENRSGILTVSGPAPDIMYGNGIYDGRFNTDPVANNNMIDRAFMMAALHPRPAKMLEIGLSTGSWTAVIASYAPLESLTVVEINKGYPALYRNYPESEAALENPKVNVVFDDGRRWLRHHPQERFDFILMNTSFYWRSNNTNLLSVEFLELARAHLNPGGVIYYNTTDSPHVYNTAAQVFKHVTRYSNFVAASDSPFDMTIAQKRVNLLQFRTPAGAPVFARDDRHLVKLGELVRYGLTDLAPQLRAEKNRWTITDDNMAVEYKVD